MGAACGNKVIRDRRIKRAKETLLSMIYTYIQPSTFALNFHMATD
jgi:hypothetical protein